MSFRSDADAQHVNHFRYRRGQVCDWADCPCLVHNGYRRTVDDESYVWEYPPLPSRRCASITLSMNNGCIARGSVICAFTVSSFHDTGARPVRFLWETKLRDGCLATAWEPNKEELLRVHSETRSVLPAIQMAWVISWRALVAVSGRVQGREPPHPLF